MAGSENQKEWVGEPPMRGREAGNDEGSWRGEERVEEMMRIKEEIGKHHSGAG